MYNTPQIACTRATAAALLLRPIASPVLFPPVVGSSDGSTDGSSDGKALGSSNGKTLDSSSSNGRTLHGVISECRFSLE
jgi:hypothetical protein